MTREIILPTNIFEEADVNFPPQEIQGSPACHISATTQCIFDHDDYDDYDHDKFHDHDNENKSI